MDSNPTPITRTLGTHRIGAYPTATGPTSYRILLDSKEDPLTVNLGIVVGRDAAKAVIAFVGNQPPNVIEAMRTAALEADVEAAVDAVEEAGTYGPD